MRRTCKVRSDIDEKAIAAYGASQFAQGFGFGLFIGMVAAAIFLL